MKKRIILIALSLVLILMSFTGCSQEAIDYLRVMEKQSKVPSMEGSYDINMSLKIDGLDGDYSMVPMAFQMLENIDIEGTYSYILENESHMYAQFNLMLKDFNMNGTTMSIPLNFYMDYDIANLKIKQIYEIPQPLSYFLDSTPYQGKQYVVYNLDRDAYSQLTGGMIDLEAFLPSSEDGISGLYNEYMDLFEQYGVALNLNIEKTVDGSDTYYKINLTNEDIKGLIRPYINMSIAVASSMYGDMMYLPSEEEIEEAIVMITGAFDEYIDIEACDYTVKLNEDEVVTENTLDFILNIKDNINGANAKLSLNVKGNTEKYNDDSISVIFPEVNENNSIDILNEIMMANSMYQNYTEPMQYEYAPEASDFLPASVKLNGVDVETDVPAGLMDGRVYLPVRAISEALGANVGFENGVAVIEKDENILVLQLGDYYAYTNELVIELDYPVFEIDGRILVPVRVVSEAFNAEVKWDQDNFIAYITTY